MDSIIFYVAFFWICFNIGGLATTNIIRLTHGNTLPVLATRCYCNHCGSAISPILQLPITSYIVCKGKCKKCKMKIPVFGLVLEIVILAGMFMILWSANFSIIGVTLSFLYYEIVRILVIIKYGRRECNFARQYIVAILAMVPYYVMTVFVSLLYGQLL